MPRSLKTCSTPGCPEIVERGRCPECKRRAERARGTSAQRGYDHHHRVLFSEAVLTRDIVCRCTEARQHGHGPVCSRPSRHADHWPLSRRELVALGLNPNDPRHGRGLCHRCHSAETAVHQPGGWAAR